MASKAKEDTFKKDLKKATKALSKYIKGIKNGRYKLDGLSIKGGTVFVTDGIFMVYGEGLRKILPDHEECTEKNYRIPDINHAIRKATHNGSYDVHHISTPRLKDGPIVFNIAGEAVGFKPDEEIDFFIGEKFNPKKHVLVNSKYLNIAAALGITSFKWDTKAQAITGENGLCGVDIIIATVQIKK